MERIVLAYSGSLADSVAIPWLAERCGAEIIAVTIDLGQGRELEEVRDRALATGAVRAHVLDARDEFARSYLVRGLKADATAPEGAPLGAALGCPLIARQLVQIAEIEQATAIAHGGMRAAMDLAAHTLNPALRVLTPARDWTMTPPQLLEYARMGRLPLPPDAGLHFTLESPAEPAAVDVAFERGGPTGINGVGMSILDLFDSLGTIAAAHGIGRPGRDLREAPAALVLHAAHRALRTRVASDDLNRLCEVIGREWAELVSRGLWFSRAREALDAFVNAVNERVTGVVRLTLFKGQCDILDARETPAEGATRLVVKRVS
jgi:argininosuccinate synthase